MAKGDSGRGRAFLAALGGTAAVIVAVASVLVVALAIHSRVGQQPEERDDALVTSTVTADTLADEVSGRVEVSAATTIPVPGTGVVTRNGVAAGNPVTQNGTVLATVEERPLFAFHGSVPAYRAIGKDTEGDDVLQLQQALAELGYDTGPIDGEFGDASARAVYQFLKDNDVTAVDAAGNPVEDDPTLATFPLGSMVFVPAFPAIPIDACGVAGEVAEGTLCSLAVQPVSVILEVAPVDAGRLTAGMVVETDLAELPTAVLGAQLPPDDTVEEGSEASSVARFALDAGTTGELTPGREAAARVVIASSEQGALRVEGAAIRDSGGSDPWLLLETGEHAAVELDICASGYCTFQSERVDEGATVVISGSLDEGE